jgi:hypothetical protein
MNFSNVLREPLLSHPSSTFLHSLRQKLLCDGTFPQRLPIFRQSLFCCNRLYSDSADSLCQNTKTESGPPSFPFKAYPGELVGPWSWSVTYTKYLVEWYLVLYLKSHMIHNVVLNQTSIFQVLLMQIYILHLDCMCKINLNFSKKKQLNSERC